MNINAVTKFKPSIQILYGHSSTVRCMAMKDNFVASGSRDNTLRLWNVNTGECVAILQE